MVNLPASFLVVKLMPQECAVQGMGFEFMEGGGRRWQVRNSIFQLRAVQKITSILTIGKSN